MGRIIESDTLQNAEVEEDGNGVLVNRGFIVGELGQGPGTLIEAKNLCPEYGEAHPSDSQIVVVRKRARPRLNSRTEAVVIVTYGPPQMIVMPSPVVRIRATTRGVRTNFDRDHKKIEVDYQDASGATFPTETGEVEGQKCFGILEAQWIEPTNPESWLLPFANTINSRSWRGWGKWTWWVRDLSIEQEKYRPGFRCAIMLELDPDTFMKTAGYRINGYIPTQVKFDDLTLGKKTGYTNVLINGEADFNKLKLP